MVLASPADPAQRGPDIPGRQSAQLKAESLTLKFASVLPAIGEEERARREKLQEELDELEQDIPVAGAPAAGPAGGETIAPDAPPPVPPGGGASPGGDFTIWRNSRLAPPHHNKAAINEPAVGNNGKYVFYTGNDYAARSVDGGATWGYVDPYADFKKLCCDQDVIYDKSRDLLFWFRLGATMKNPGEVSRFRFGVSANGGASFCFWNWRPTDFEAAWSKASWDYPQLALSNDHLYLSIVVRSAGNFSGEYYPVLARAPLDTLRTCGNLSWTFWVQDSAKFGCYSGPRKVSSVWTPVQGARETMYLGETTTNDCFTIWRQREKNNILEQFRSTVPGWTVLTKNTARKSINLTCRLPDPGGDPCQRIDHRVKAGWVGKNLVGFFWVAAMGGSFPMPYLDAATFQESDLARVGRPYIWSKNYAWAWAGAYPNERGDVGIAAWRMGGGRYPELYAGISDDFGGAPPPWDLKVVARSTGATGKDYWGDYLRVRPHFPSGLAWILSGYVSVKNAKGNVVAQPHFAIFGRARDTWSVKRWWDQP
jgi:hypothetical protein